jgi:hypothetical protein
VLAGLHILNPNAFIVRTNLARPVSERPFDAAYATTLGADAVPALLEAFPRLAAQERCTVATNLLKKWGAENDASDWRTWNWSRARARSLVHNQAQTLRASCSTTAPGGQHNDH